MAKQVFNLNSNIFPCVCVSMYETVLSPMHYEKYMNDENEEFEYVTVRLEDWKKELTKVATNYIKQNFLPLLQKYGVENIEGTGIWSPKYYNYTGDSLDMAVTMKNGWEAIMRKSLQKFSKITDCKEYIKENWHSRSGFCSFMPKSVEEVLTESDKDRRLAAYLTLALVYEDVLEPAGDSMENLWESGMYEFGDYDRVNVLAEYLDEGDAEDMLRLWDNDDAWNELYWDLFHKCGDMWRYDQDSKVLQGKKDSGYQWQADSAGKRMLFWAVKHQYTVADLYDMAA